MTEEVQVKTLLRTDQKQITVHNFADFVPPYAGYYQVLVFTFGDCTCQLKLTQMTGGRCRIDIHFPPNRQFFKFEFVAWSKAQPNEKYSTACDESCHQAPLNVARRGVRCARHSLDVPLVTDITFMLTVHYRVARCNGKEMPLWRRPVTNDMGQVDPPLYDSSPSVNSRPLRVNPVVMDVSSPQPVMAHSVGHKRPCEEGEGVEAKRQK